MGLGVMWHGTFHLCFNAIKSTPGPDSLSWGEAWFAITALDWDLENLDFYSKLLHCDQVQDPLNLRPSDIVMGQKPEPYYKQAWSC